MSRVAIRKASLFVILLACMFATAGCPEIKRLEAENRRLMERNEALQQERDRLLAGDSASQNLQAQLDAKDQTIAERDADITKKTEALLAQEAMIAKLRKALQDRKPIKLPEQLNQALVEIRKTPLDDSDVKARAKVARLVLQRLASESGFELQSRREPKR